MGTNLNDKYILSFDAFIRSFKQNKDIACAFFLGAGASITSGIQSASDCIWEWKKEIYTTSNSSPSSYISNYKSDIVKAKIQQWLDSKQVFPAKDSPEEYSYYAEKAYPIEADRRSYFLNLASDKEPYVGYKLLCLLSKHNIVKSVWTTNFDGLTERAAHQLNITPIAVNLDNPDLIYRTQSKKELLYVALHGDYKYTKLKNTAKELDSQNSTFVDILKQYFVDKNLVVIGYSGRDKSLMKALLEAFTEKGAGRLYWCGYGDSYSKEVEDLITTIQNTGRSAYYVPTDGFDKTIITLAMACFEGQHAIQNEISEIIKSYPQENHTTPFKINQEKASKYLRSNLFPIILPKEVFQFEIKFNDGKGRWKTIKDRTKNKPIFAVPFKNKVYAISTLTMINGCFGDCIKGEIVRVPISMSDIERNGIFKELFLKSILYGIAHSRKLHTNLKTIIWDNIVFSKKNDVVCYKAIECNLIFKENENDYAFLSIKPTLYISSDSITIHDRMSYNKDYLEKLWNKKYDDEIAYWQEKIFGSDNFSFYVPLNSCSDFKFVIGKNRANVSIHVIDPNFRPFISDDIDQKSIMYRGEQYLEPQLEFVNDQNGRITKDYHPMRGLTNHKPYDSEFYDVVFPNKVKLGIICPSKFSNQFSVFLQAINQVAYIKKNNDYVMDFKGFQNTFNIPIDIPNIDSEEWINLNDDYENSISLAKIIVQSIDKLTNYDSFRVITIFIPSFWQRHRQFFNNNESFDLHDYIKAYAASKNVATQIIEEKTVISSMKCEIYWWLSLAFYVKSMHTPWALSNMEQETAYAGIGYSVKKDSKGKTNIVLGCSHIYNAKGQGLKYKLSKIHNPFFDKKNNPYLTYDEAFKLGVSIRELFMQSMEDLPKRVVVHKRTAFRKEEINGLSDALSLAGIENLDLIEINYEYDIRLLALSAKNDSLIADRFPLSRGTCVLISNNTALLWTHGIVPSVKKQNYKYFQGGRSIPSPLRIVKHYGKGDLSTICSEILGLTKMNWNSFNLYSKLPATIDTSNTIAKIGNLLSKYEGRTYDYRLLI